MSSNRMIAIILIVLGILSFSYEGIITYRTRDKIIDAGPIQVTADNTHKIRVPEVVGAVALVGGVILLVGSLKRA